MSAQSSKLIRNLRMVLIGAPLLLAACHSDVGPFPMPSGYTYHNEPYKSPRGPEPVLKKVAPHVHGDCLHCDSSPAYVDIEDDRTASLQRTVHVEKTTTTTMMMDEEPEVVVYDQTEFTDVAAAPAIYEAAPISNDSVWNTAAGDLLDRLMAGYGSLQGALYIAAPGVLNGELAAFNNALHDAAKARNIALAPSMAGAVHSLEYDIVALNVGDATRRLLTVTLLTGGIVATEESGIYNVGAPDLVMQVQPSDAPIMLTPQ